MAPNLPPSITVNRNLAATLKNYIKANGGKNVSEAELNNILQKVAKFDSERDSGTREGGSIFSGGSKYLGGSGKDFVVKQGQQIQLSTEEFNEIFKGYIDPVKTQETEKPPLEPLDNTPITTDLKPKKTTIPDKIDLPASVKKQETEALLDSVDGKVIERQVNGTKQKIAVATVDGQKVRRAINEDGSLGEILVTVSTAGKNKYITQSEMDNRMRAALGLADNEEIPKDIKGEFVNIGGSPTLIFKKDGKTMDQAQLREYVAEIQEQKIGKFNANANTPLKAPVTGPPEGQNPEYDALVKGNDTPIQTTKYNYDNDKTYKTLDSELKRLQAEISKFEKENNISENDRFSKSKAMLADGYSDYRMNKHIYENLKDDFESYKKVMDNWQDGKKSPAFTANRTVNGQTLLNVNYTNIECITLKNGQKAYKTDQGTFYPYQNGNPGQQKVPDELL